VIIIIIGLVVSIMQGGMARARASISYLATILHPSSTALLLHSQTVYMVNEV
jgi:hypothetical protein